MQACFYLFCLLFCRNLPCYVMSNEMIHKRLQVPWLPFGGCCKTKLKLKCNFRIFDSCLSRIAVNYILNPKRYDNAYVSFINRKFPLPHHPVVFQFKVICQGKNFKF